VDVLGVGLAIALDCAMSFTTASGAAFVYNGCKRAKTCRISVLFDDVPKTTLQSSKTIQLCKKQKHM
jgi:hypothetical protein